MLVSWVKKYSFIVSVASLVGASFNAYAMHAEETPEKRQKRIIAASHRLKRVRA